MAANITFSLETDESSVRRIVPPTLTITSPLVPLTIAEERKLKLLRYRLHPLMKHPVYGPRLDLSNSALSKWLMVCDNNVLLADAKIRKCLEYRRAHKIDDLLTDFRLPDFAKHYPGGVCGQDKQGSPVYYELFGILSLKDIIDSSTRQDLFKFKIYQHELIIQHMKELSRKRGRKVDTILVIVDMKSCKMEALWGPSLRIWAEIIEILQDLYPGLVKEVLIINVHFVYTELYLSLRPYLNRCTLKLIKVMGQGYLKHLLQRVEKHEIPAFLGGYKCDYNNNPRCLADLNWNTQIPQFMHLINKTTVADVNERLILGGDKSVEEYHVPTANSVLIWKFLDVSHPIQFSIYLNNTDNKSAVLRRTTVSSREHNQGWLMCDRPGRYLLLLDNCKNYSAAVKVLFTVEIKLPPDVMARLAPKIPLGHTIDFSCQIKEAEDNVREEVSKKYTRMIRKRAFRNSLLQMRVPKDSMW